jgi:hypothetical protein
MPKSDCTISFYRNDLQKTRLDRGNCPVKNCGVNINRHKAPFQRYKGKMRNLPFCPEHGIRIHKNCFVYYNGSSKSDLTTSIKRNLMFHSDYYSANFLEKGNKMESGRLCYESSEDAVSYNVFTELLSNGNALRKLVSHITRKKIEDEVELYLWGGKIDLRNNIFTKYTPLEEVRRHLEGDIKRFGTEPDIMLVVPKKIVICIEAKFGSKNPIAKERKETEGDKPSGKDKLIKRYCKGNNIIDTSQLFDFSNMPKLFYEQIFRNIVFAASMAKLEGKAEWYVVNLRNQYIMNMKKGKPESMPIVLNIRSILKSKHKKQFTHLTWEVIYEKIIKGNDELANLIWYLKNKSLGCGRAFNVL